MPMTQPAVRQHVPWTAARTAGDGRLVLGGFCLIAIAVCGLAANTPAPLTNTPAVPVCGYTYVHDEVARVPWSIHIVKVDRKRTDLALETTLGSGTRIGLEVVSEQVKSIPLELGQPVAAINGDFFSGADACPGDPEGLQIIRGELVSAPHPNRVAFWVDEARNFHRACVAPLFEVIWPDGTKTPVGLNEAREADTAVLYTAAMGPSTLTYKGCELVLARQTNSPWLPLQAGTNYLARIIRRNEAGDSPLPADGMVLSLGSRLAAQLPKTWNGAVLKISTATTPSLMGVRTGLGGGPGLVHEGKLTPVTGYLHLRHPRSAIGWNKDYFFMVEVDGRQRKSVGMTFPELAEYMLKLGCEEAMNLDGGGSATLWVDGKVVNSPSRGQERPAANALALLKKTKK